MSQISYLNEYSIDPFSNAQMKRRYLRHKSKIEEIGKKSSGYNDMEQEQQRIMDAVHKSKQISRKFQLQQFQLQKSIENKRMINHLSRFQSRKHSILDGIDDATILKRSKSNAKQQILRKFQINLQNKYMNQHLQEYTVNKKKYRKKVKQQVEQYQKLRQHMQRFKNSNSSDSRVSTKKMRALSNRPKKRSRNNMDNLFFKEQNNLSANDKRIIKSRSLPPLQHMMV